MPWKDMLSFTVDFQLFCFFSQNTNNNIHTVSAYCGQQVRSDAGVEQVFGTDNPKP